MAHIDVTVIGDDHEPAARTSPLRELTEVIVEVFDRPRETVTARLTVSTAGEWTLGGDELPAGAAGAQVVIRVLEGAAGDARRKGEAVARATGAVRRCLGSGDLPINVVIEGVPAENWGFNGITFPMMRLPRTAN